MKKMIKSIIAGVLGTAILASSPALAQKVAFYDHGEVVRGSKAWKSVQTQLEGKRAEIKAQLDPIAKEVSDEGAAIEKAIEGKSEEQIKNQFGERIGQYQAKATQLQRTSNRVNQEFSVVLELTEGKINETLMDGVFEDVAKKKRVDVLTRQTALGYYANKHDVTDDVLEALDRKLATLSVDQLIEEVQKRQLAAQAAAAN